jgi:hypothetical protein
VIAKARIDGLPTSRPRIHDYAKGHQWPCREVNGDGHRGGKHFESQPQLSAEQYQALIDFEKLNKRSSPVAAEVKGAGHSDSGAGAPGATPVSIEAATGEIISTPGTQQYQPLRAELWRRAEAKPQTVREEATKDAGTVVNAFDLIEAGYPKDGGIRGSRTSARCLGYQRPGMD